MREGPLSLFLLLLEGLARGAAILGLVYLGWKSSGHVDFAHGFIGLILVLACSALLLLLVLFLFGCFLAGDGPGSWQSKIKPQTLRVVAYAVIGGSLGLMAAYFKLGGFALVGGGLALLFGITTLHVAEFRRTEAEVPPLPTHLPEASVEPPPRDIDLMPTGATRGGFPGDLSPIPAGPHDSPPVRPS